MAMAAIPLLETGRLHLRGSRMADAEAVQRLAGARALAATAANLPHPYPDGAAAAWIATHETVASSGDGFTWAVTERLGGELLGAISMSVARAHRRGEMGYWMGVPFWNKGYTTEAVTRVVAFGFERLGLYRVQAMCLPTNLGSVRVLEKVGMRHEGTMRCYVQKWGVMEDRALYGVLRPEWERQQAGVGGDESTAATGR